MKKLENQLGGTLFIRSKQGVTLTPEGRTLFEFINDSLETLNSAENLFAKYQNLEKGELRINCGNTLMELALMKPLLRFTKDYPKLDLLIRTSGEKRISNFLLWQLGYAELYFTDVYWPDFNKDELIKAIYDYQHRNRRFGGLNDNK